ncbi:histidine kinase [Actinomycetaceae bacterium L2_0104]
MDKEIFAPLCQMPWRFVVSRWPWLCVGYLTGTVILAVVTMGFVVLFPLLPLWVQMMGEIEVRRADVLLPRRLRTGLGQRWDWNALWSRLRSVAGWRQAALAMLVVVLAVFALIVAFIAVTLAVTVYRLIEGRGVLLTGTHWILSAEEPMWQRLGVAALFIAAIVMALYILTAVALLQVLLTRTMFGVDSLQWQVGRFTERNTALVTAFEAERQRIERELHDGPQQHLANAAIQLGLARSQLREGGADAHLELVQSELEAGAQALRSALRGLRPRTLLEEGLGADISEMAKSAPIPIDVAYDVDRRLDPATEASLHFVVAEFLSNTYRHSRAYEVRIHVSEVDGMLCLAMMDDGVGGADSRGGTGIAGMMNRARLLGGTLELTSPHGGPTRITLRCPLEIPEKDASKASLNQEGC